MTMLKSLLMTLTLSLLFLGCSAAEPTPTTTPAKMGKSLEGTNWNLVSFGLTRMAVPQKASITFKEGHYNGHGGCNGVGGNYVLEGEKLTLSAGFSTMMACPELDLEHKYMKYLGSVTGYSIEGNMLDLRSDDKILLRFKAE